MNTAREMDYHVLIGLYQEYMNGLVESVEHSDKAEAMERIAMLLLVAQNILKLSVLKQEKQCFGVANALLQNTTQLSLCLGEVWSCSNVDQAEMSKLLIPVLERLRKIPMYN